MATLRALLAALALAASVYPDRVVESVTDGDTLAVAPTIGGARSIRMLNIDAPERGGDTQEPWATASRDHLRALAPIGTRVAVYTEWEERDTFGRVLGHVVREHDALNVNWEQVLKGHAVMYVIWPNDSLFEAYRAAQVDAQQAERGVWDPRRPLQELPFEYRLRGARERPSRLVGDYFTRRYVEPADYRLVHVNNRVFFADGFDARSAGYLPCPRDLAGSYDGACFAPGS